MAPRWIEALTGPLEQKKEWRRYVGRIRALPEPYRTAAEALQRYLMYAGGITDGATLVRMFDDAADLWERAAADGSAVRDIVGTDPVEFAEAFTRAYSGRQWIDKERDRLRASIDGVTGGTGGSAEA